MPAMANCTWKVPSFSTSSAGGTEMISDSADSQSSTSRPEWPRIRESSYARSRIRFWISSASAEMGSLFSRTTSLPADFVCLFISVSSFNDSNSNRITKRISKQQRHKRGYKRSVVVFCCNPDNRLTQISCRACQCHSYSSRALGEQKNCKEELA